MNDSNNGRAVGRQYYDLDWTQEGYRFTLLTESAAHLPPEATSDPNAEGFPALIQMDGAGDDFEESEESILDFALAS